MEKINFQNNITPASAETFNYAFQLMHPVGSIYMTTVETNPADIFGFGTWELWGAGRVPVGVDTTQTEFNAVEKTGGEKTHTLTVDEMPAHRHELNGITTVGDRVSYVAIGGSTGATGNISSSGNHSTGGSQAHNNLQPYIACYMFKRVA